MTMDFGSTESPTEDMLAAVKDALDATLTQVTDLYAAHGVSLSGADRWARIGATPMIGQNDVIGEVFTLDDARGLADFALAKGLGRVSTWSLNRDAPCSASFADVMVLSNTCSSVDQQPLEFASVFTVLPGSAQVAAPHRSGGTARPDHHRRRPGHQPVPDLAPRRPVPRRLQGRAPRPGLRRQVVEPGRRPGRSSPRTRGTALDADGPGGPERRTVHARRPSPTGTHPNGTRRSSTRPATRCCSTGCRTRPAGRTRKRRRRCCSPWAPTPRGSRCSPCPVSPRNS
jgi:hypothetical protein